jgi:hypothetical protein
VSSRIEDKQKKQQNLRQKNQHAADAGNYAVNDQIVQKTFGQTRPTKSPSAPKPLFEQIHRQIRPRKNRLKNQQQNAD